MKTIKSYTDMEQSRKLAEFLPLESADNVIVKFGDREGTKTVVMPKETFDAIRTPFADIRETTMCWNLTALFKMLPKSAYLEKGSSTELCRLTLPVELISSDWNFEPVDACYEMILKLHELNLL